MEIGKYIFSMQYLGKSPYFIYIFRLIMQKFVYLSVGVFTYFLLSLTEAKTPHLTTHFCSVFRHCAE